MATSTYTDTAIQIWVFTALVHVWTAPRMREKNEKADGRVDCDHVSGLVDAAQ